MLAVAAIYGGLSMQKEADRKSQIAETTSK
jgi:hypothetical protein